VLVLRLPKDIEARLDDLAKRTGRTKSFYAREAILEYLEDMEDIYLAEAELAEIIRGAPTFSLDEVEKELGLER